MGSISEIYFNYNKAISQADQLDEIARRLNDAANQTMEDILNEVQRAWKSDSASEYLRKGNKVGGDVRTTAQNLQNIAQAIRKIAKRVMQAELEAWRIANERL